MEKGFVAKNVCVTPFAHCSKRAMPALIENKNQKSPFQQSPRMGKHPNHT
jgi:hypothetical protein